MKVKDLMYMLMKSNPDADVLMSIDAEGNRFHPLFFVEGDVVWNNVVRDANIGFKTLTDELKECGFTEDVVMEGGQDCIILYPNS